MVISVHWVLAFAFYVLRADSFRYSLFSRPIFERSLSNSAEKSELRRQYPQLSSSKVLIQETGDLSLPRLSEDLNSLLQWVNNENGYVNARVNKTIEGWTLISTQDSIAGTIMASIPKRLCVFSDPESDGAVEMPVLTNTLRLMLSLDSKQWRVRLAVALLSERVRPNSFYRSYLRNLPFEFWGVPMFFNSSIFSMIQDLSLMQRTRDRCRFLLEFTDNVLVPLHKTSLDPFLSQSADVNAFGWAFAAAASRALRNPTAINATGPVMVPIIDIASHSFQPTCEVIDTGNSFELRAIKDIPAGYELTIDYGPLSNDEIFADYGFSVDDNKYDRIQLNCDGTVINTARTAMGQTSTSSSSSTLTPIVNNQSSKRLIKIGRGSEKFEESWLHRWQSIWLQSIGMMGHAPDIAVSIGGPDPSRIDPKLWALLRIIYSKTENDLLQHGYDPFTLQHQCALLSTDIETHVIRTLTGIIAIVLRLYSTEESADIEFLENGLVDQELEARSSASSDDISTDVYNLIRNALGYPAILPITVPMATTLRRMNNMNNNNGGDVSTTTTGSTTSASSTSTASSMSPLLVLPEEDHSSSLEDLIRKEQQSNSPVNNNNNKDKDNIQRQEGYIQDIRGSRNGYIDSLDNGVLSVNVREVIKYRLRKKRMLSGLIKNLNKIYKQLDPSDPDGLLPPPPPTSGDGRRARIRELLNEVRSRTAPKEESELLTVASKLSSKWAEKGLSL